IRDRPIVVVEWNIEPWRSCFHRPVGLITAFTSPTGRKSRLRDRASGPAIGCSGIVLASRRQRALNNDAAGPLDPEGPRQCEGSRIRGFRFGAPALVGPDPRRRHDYRPAG